MNCGKYHSLGPKCVEPADHPGPHKSEHGFAWTDLQDRLSANAIAKSMEGKRD